MNIVLHQPQIPPNTGNIARLCVATKTRLHLIRPLGFATDDATLRRAGLDYWQYLEIFYHENWEDFLKSHAESRLFFFSKKAKASYTSVEYREGDCLVFGSETQGLPESMLQRYADRLYGIPMWGETRSLNLSTSVGIVLYEALRQVHRGFTEFY
ncbi:MAG: tRNA (uridine(34)/cytosine(34)/5-carboxymethylaminomethyluridine(34)-2'-O)-methyltransferase TrmL [Deltaproteobacteria bacterium]|nr:tRNA (uridine(34)/cytosine(34)/5-carboxymethylaminomethyluridine(34)-2'-O)-methyltransferase TrmL [Deltaproteobacteria bacterium]